MIRLADYLFRWTGDVQYADYIERNLYNGILAQQNPETGMVAYFLPLEPGAQKIWGSPTDDFWCCHGTLVQAQASTTATSITPIAPDSSGPVHSVRSEMDLEWDAGSFQPANPRRGRRPPIHLERDPDQRPNHLLVELHVEADQPAEFALKVRMPWWLRGNPVVTINGKQEQLDASPSSFLTLRRTWNKDVIRVALPKGLSSSPLPDRPDTVAFMDGPNVLAALTDEAVTLNGDPNSPEKILIPDDEREWSVWLPGYRTVNQDHNLRFVPINTITDQKYTVYFQVRRSV